MEFLRKAAERLRRSRERREMNAIDATPARLGPEFAAFSPDELLDHFRQRASPRLWAQDIAATQRSVFPDETAALLAAADRIVNENTWAIGGFGPITFYKSNYWRSDPLTGVDWGLDYHADIPIYTPGGPDIRVLWELNRFGHVLTLARAFAITAEERYAETFFRHIEEWTAQNPYARGANWVSPMDVIMRATSVVAAFELTKGAECCTPERLALVLKLADTHCRFTVDNNEFSYIAIGNHYLTNVAGLFFVATLLPELQHAAEWREFGLRELLRETERQVLPDGADWESSTGYHKFVTEMLLVCLILAERNEVGIAENNKLRCNKMLAYLRGVMRPDRAMPLIGDCDGSQFLPIVRRDADDAKYLLDLAAAVCDDAEFKIGEDCSPEVLWLLGHKGVDRFNALRRASQGSVSSPNAGTHVLRHDDLYISLNANDIGLNGRGSHSHNDALSIELSALGRPWIVDPGSYVYNLDREARHRFRSTSYHSTVVIDGREQNAIEVDEPFVSSNDARPQLITLDLDGPVQTVACDHYGYPPMIHRRTVTLDRARRVFSILDELSRLPENAFVSFHLAPGLSADLDGDVVIVSDIDGRRLAFVSDIRTVPEVIDAEFSRHSGKIEPSKVIRWPMRTGATIFHLVPLSRNDDLPTRLAALQDLLHNNS